VKFVARLSNLKKKEEEKPATPPAPPAPSKEEVLLTEIRDLLKEKK
jgi:large conductance mechanosensitive channel